MSSRSRSHGLLGSIALALFALPLGCGGGGGNVQTGPSAEGSTATRSADCGSTKRSAPECGAPLDAKAFDVSSGSSKQSETAIRRINEQIKDLADEQARLCSDYTACSIDEGAFKKGVASIKTRMDALPPLVEAMKSAKTYGQKKRALDELYRGVVPAEKRVEELTFRMGMTAQLPESAGGKMIDVEPGATLPTNTRAAFSFEVSRDAYLYIFQKSPSGEVNVLFPSAMISTKNPLRAGMSVQIPPNGQRFRLNDKDLGMENVYLVASRDPIQSLDASLEKVKSGKVTMITQDSMLRGFTQMVPGTAPADCKTRAFELEPSPDQAPAAAECARTRGLVLEPPDEQRKAPGRAMPMEGGPAGSPPPAPPADTPTSLTGRAVMEVRTDPGDNMIVKIFPFKHVSEAELTSTLKAAPPGAPAVKTRGLVIEY